ncbi:MAG TPA: hypothetical protein PLE12_06060 [Propionicimonas sp.]|jgi:Flp pilus assembly protein TadB|nr:hypothetical protein [Propionicimonas sp.]
MTVLLAALSGCLVVAGVWALVLSGVRTHPRLDDTFALLDGRLTAGPEPEAEGFDRVGAWLRQRSSLGVGDDTRRRLRIVGTSVDRHLARKAVGALLGLILPGLAGGWLSWLTGVPVVLPVLLGVAGAAVGFILPDLLLRQRDRAVTEDATEALLTFFDLVTLERLANLSGTQALRSAANSSGATVFVAIRDALERARLEQRAPYGELQRLGEELRLPALVDVADVMRLDETGASLSGALRARVRELRDAHLNRLKVEASAVSERMGMLMVVPSLIFGLLFLTPPLLRLVGG